MIYIGKGYPESFNTSFCCELLPLTNDVHDAHFLLFPVFYEILYEYSDDEYIKWKYSKADVEVVRRIFIELVSLAEKTLKKLVIFYYRDPSEPLNIPNAIVFRTSLYKQSRGKLEFGLPAFIEDQKKLFIKGKPFLKKEALPSVGFRGQSAPLSFDWKTIIRLGINTALKKVHSRKQINVYYCRGYLARRAALVSILKSTKVNANFKITSWNNIPDPTFYKMDFLNNLFKNPYNVCASGYGNYSYRLYEVLSAGRIPIFINTDCVLPFEEFIDWKKHVIWVDESDVAKTGQILNDFHQSIHPDDFIERQIKNRELWENKLSHTGFFSNIDLYLEKLKKI